MNERNFVVGSEDKTVRVWGLTLGLVVATFRHQATITSVIAMLDGRRVVSSDRAGTIRVWAADSGTLIQSVCGPGRCFAVAADMRCQKNSNVFRTKMYDPLTFQSIFYHFIDLLFVVPGTIKFE